jgi:CMP-N-acetylneuraminate monooxygenase
VIDLMPGDRWDAGHDRIARAPARASAIDRERFAAAFPTDERLTPDRLIAYLQRLNDIPDIAHCEDLTVRMIGTATDPNRTIDLAFTIAGGRLSILAAPPERANLTMAMPLAVMTAIITRDLSWDEAFIGYWCLFDRHPNVYHAGFWRLFQAPYFMKPPQLDEVRTAPGSPITRESTVAELLESHGAIADRIMRRYGLYCLGCHHSTADTLALAARHHGIDARRLDLLVDELTHAASYNTTT